MKVKTLKKKIRRLETRLQEGPKKLARLKRKLEAQMAADAAKARKKAAARAAATRRKTKTSTSAAGASRQPIALPLAKPAPTRKPAAPAKVKRTLNLSPERRAQLAGAMRARWAAKRAEAGTKSPDRVANRDLTLAPPPKESGNAGDPTG